MANIDGVWDLKIETPMGAQSTRMTVTSDGDSFSATAEGSLGEIHIQDGKIDGDEISWTMEISKPMTMSVDGSAVISGDTLSGKVKAGMLGSLDLSGERVS